MPCSLSLLIKLFLLISISHYSARSDDPISNNNNNNYGDGGAVNGTICQYPNCHPPPAAGYQPYTAPPPPAAEGVNCPPPAPVQCCGGQGGYQYGRGIGFGGGQNGGQGQGQPPPFYNPYNDSAGAESAKILSLHVEIVFFSALLFLHMTI